jgi:hypothetical protein
MQIWISACAGMSGDGRIMKYLANGALLLSEQQQTRAWIDVIAGGPRRVRSATHLEQHLRSYPPTNLVYPPAS